MIRSRGRSLPRIAGGGVIGAGGERDRCINVAAHCEGPSFAVLGILEAARRPRVANRAAINRQRQITNGKLLRSCYAFLVLPFAPRMHHRYSRLRRAILANHEEGV
jgi:hypothetical protein